jgi:hypothetical protein
VTKARQILMKLQVSAFVNEVVAVEIEDVPGSLAKLLKPLRDANINVIMMYAFIGFSSGKAVMIFRFSDDDQAIEILKSNDYRLLDSETFGILENEAKVC